MNKQFNPINKIFLIKRLERFLTIRVFHSCSRKPLHSGKLLTPNIDQYRLENPMRRCLKLFSTLLLLSALCSASLAASQLDAIQARGELVFGTSGSMPRASSWQARVVTTQLPNALDGLLVRETDAADAR